MARTVHYLLERGGRYYARVVVPQRLRPIIGKTELTAPLGADRRIALRDLSAVVADFRDRINAAEARVGGANLRRPFATPAPDATELARAHYEMRCTPTGRHF